MTPAPQRGSVSPIADLSYRGYDGPLRAHSPRWWIVALSGIRGLLKNHWFWALAALACLPFVFNGLVFYVSQSVGGFGGDPASNPMMMTDKGGHRYAMVFFQALSGWETLWWFGIALMVGAGSIASDNRANALQVYLSKPITKGDYLLGKWMSIFLTISGVALAPMLILFAFLGAAFASQGFFSSEPTLLPRLLLVAVLPGFIHASLLVGFSAWCSSSRVAGALYAAVYFIGGLVVGIMWLLIYHQRMDKGVLLQHCSIGGIITGLTQSILGVTIHSNAFSRRHGSLMDLTVPPPNLWIMLAIAAAICVIGVGAARARIRAVEVVKG
jgi:ABC-2 type transport system permease protein